LSHGDVRAAEKCKFLCDREKSKRVMEAMMQMVKLDLDELQKAYNQSA
jgi:hypothetical protein